MRKLLVVIFAGLMVLTWGLPNAGATTFEKVHVVLNGQGMDTILNAHTACFDCKVQGVLQESNPYVNGCFATDYVRLWRKNLDGSYVILQSASDTTCQPQNVSTGWYDTCSTGTPRWLHTEARYRVRNNGNWSSWKITNTPANYVSCT